MTNRSRILLMSCVLALVAQRDAFATSGEVFGGYTVGQTKPDDHSDGATLKGWNASVTMYPWYRFGITADVAGLYGASVPGAGGDAAPPLSGRQYSFLAGPQIRLFRSDRFDTSVRFLAGGARGYAPTALYPASEETAFAALAGTNVDLHLGRGFALRFSPGLYVTQFGDKTQTSLRFSIGPVFHWGREE